MKIYEIGTGYTPIPPQMGAATENVVEEGPFKRVVMMYRFWIFRPRIGRRTTFRFVKFQSLSAFAARMFSWVFCTN